MAHTELDLRERRVIEDMLHEHAAAREDQQQREGR